MTGTALEAAAAQALNELREELGAASWAVVEAQTRLKAIDRQIAELQRLRPQVVAEIELKERLRDQHMWRTLDRRTALTLLAEGAG